MAEITQTCLNEIRNTGINTMRVISATGNDLKNKNKNLKDLTKNYRGLLEMYHEKGKKIIIIEILSRLHDTKYWYNYTYCVNQKLMCADLNTPFIETELF